MSFFVVHLTKPAPIQFSYCFGNIDDDVNTNAFHDFLKDLEGIKTGLSLRQTLEDIFAHLKSRGKKESILLLVDEISKANGSHSSPSGKVDQTYPMVQIVSILGRSLSAFPDSSKYMVLYTSLDEIAFRTESIG